MSRIFRQDPTWRPFTLLIWGCSKHKNSLSEMTIRWGMRKQVAWNDTKCKIGRSGLQWRTKRNLSLYSLICMCDWTYLSTCTIVYHQSKMSSKSAKARDNSTILIDPKHSYQVVGINGLHITYRCFVFVLHIIEMNCSATYALVLQHNICVYMSLHPFDAGCNDGKTHRSLVEST